MLRCAVFSSASVVSRGIGGIGGIAPDVRLSSRDVPVDVLTLSPARLPLASQCAWFVAAVSLLSRPRWPVPRGAALPHSGPQIVALENMDVRAAALLSLGKSMAVEAGARVARGCKRSAAAGRAQRGLDLSHKHFGTYRAAGL